MNISPTNSHNYASQQYYHSPPTLITHYHPLFPGQTRQKQPQIPEDGLQRHQSVHGDPKKVGHPNSCALRPRPRARNIPEADVELRRKSSKIRKKIRRKTDPTRPPNHLLQKSPPRNHRTLDHPKILDKASNQHRHPGLPDVKKFQPPLDNSKKSRYNN